MWTIGPDEPEVRRTRRYAGDTLVLETEVETAGGTVVQTDLMPVGAGASRVVRMVRGVRGRVAMTMALRLRWDYGFVVPWATQVDGEDGTLLLVAGPDMAVLRCSVPTRGEEMATVARFEVAEGDTAWFDLAYAPSNEPPPAAIDVAAALRATTAFWSAWSDSGSVSGRYATAVRRSLLTLKALTYAPTGGIVAAPTTSLPEQIGGPRNWDYRYCWLRDATITLSALMQTGHYEEARAWRDWLHRAVAGSPDQIQIMYGVAGERRLAEWTVEWLGGYRGSSPVRIGNAAAGQLQLDVFGEVANALYQARAGGLDHAEGSWDVLRAMVDHLSSIWRDPDEGIWETRGGRRHFVFSKVMAWVAFDRAIRAAQEFGFEGAVDAWRAERDAVHAMVCAQGYDAARGSFVAWFGAQSLDASLLLLPLIGFLPLNDPRIVGTVRAVEADLLRGGFVLRYDTADGKDGLPPGEGAFLACSFWLVMVRAAQGRWTDATALFERLLGLANDVGLLAEEYDPVGLRQVGNFPQAFSHVALVGAAMALADAPPAVG